GDDRLLQGDDVQVLQVGLEVRDPCGVRDSGGDLVERHPLGDDGGATPGTVRAAGQLERADVGVDDPGGTAGAEDTEHDVVLVDPFADVPQVVVVPGVLLLGDSRSDRLGGEVVQQPVERLAVDEPA